jgi:DNA-binding CsgD family transcriptional regulator
MHTSIDNNNLEKQVNEAICLSDQHRRVLYCNNSMLEAWSTRQIKIEDGIINCENPHDTLRLHAAILDAIKYNKEQIFVIRNQAGSIVDLIMARPYNKNIPESSDDLALLIVQHTEPKSCRFKERLKSLFSFTDTECTICESLLMGLDAKEIADERKVSLSTVRSQLTSIMLKARCRRQVELVSLLSRISVVP